MTMANHELPTQHNEKREKRLYQTPIIINYRQARDLLLNQKFQCCSNAKKQKKNRLQRLTMKDCFHL